MYMCIPRSQETIWYVVMCISRQPSYSKQQKQTDNQRKIFVLDLSIPLLCTVDATFKCQTRKLTCIHISI